MKSHKLPLLNVPIMTQICTSAANTETWLFKCGLLQENNFLLETSCECVWKYFYVWVPFGNTETIVHMRWSVGKPEGLTMGRVVWAWPMFEYIYSNSGNLSGWPLVFWMGDQKMDRKYWVKVKLLSWMKYFSQDHRDNLGTARIEREWKREKKLEREW